MYGQPITASNTPSSSRAAAVTAAWSNSAKVDFSMSRSPGKTNKRNDTHSLSISLSHSLPHARCVLHVHSIFATVLASLQDSRLPAIDQNTAIFFDRLLIDEGYGGFAFEDEGIRCAAQFTDPRKKVMVMGNHPDSPSK